MVYRNQWYIKTVVITVRKVKNFFEDQKIEEGLIDNNSE